MSRSKGTVVIGWVPRRLCVCVYLSKSRLWAPKRKDHGKLVQSWIAVDTNGYHVAQGRTPLKAIESLLMTCQANEQLAEEARRKGQRVSRQKLHRQMSRLPMLPNELIAYREKALRQKDGFVLDGVDWRKWLTEVR